MFTRDFIQEDEMVKLLLLILILAPAAYANDTTDFKDFSDSHLETRITNVSSSITASRLDELERRLGDLERINRAQDDRIRQLDRTLDDLKRRR